MAVSAAADAKTIPIKQQDVPATSGSFAGIFCFRNCPGEHLRRWLCKVKEPADVA